MHQSPIDSPPPKHIVTTTQTPGRGREFLGEERGHQAGPQARADAQREQFPDFLRCHFISSLNKFQPPTNSTHITVPATNSTTIGTTVPRGARSPPGGLVSRTGRKRPNLLP